MGLGQFDQLAQAWYNGIMKELKEYPGLYVTESGEVYSNTRGPIRKLKCYYNENGYLRVKFNYKEYSVHRLVAMAFIPNPLNLPQVDHIDDIRDNNIVSNLQWITPQANTEKSQAKNYTLEFIETGEIVEVFNLRKFGRDHNLCPSSLRQTKNPTGKRGGYSQHKGWRMIK